MSGLTPGLRFSQGGQDRLAIPGRPQKGLSRGVLPSPAVLVFGGAVYAPRCCAAHDYKENAATVNKITAVGNRGNAPLPMPGLREPPRRRAGEMPALEQLDDMLGLASLMSRELSQGRRVGSRPALLLMQVEARAERGGQALSLVQQSALLAAVGARLRRRVRGHDVVARIGSLRFAVVLQHMERAPLTPIQLRLQRALSGPYELHEQLLFASLRVGAAACSSQRASGLELSQAAESAMEQALPDSSWGELRPWRGDGLGSQAEPS